MKRYLYDAEWEELREDSNGDWISYKEHMESVQLLRDVVSAAREVVKGWGMFPNDSWAIEERELKKALDRLKQKEK